MLHTGKGHHMKTVISFTLLAVFGFSLFFLIFIPIEAYNVVRAWDWEQVEVTITKSEIERVRGRFYLNIRIRDLETDTISESVSVRYGDISLSIIFIGWLMESNLYDDQDNYPEGMITTAYRSPDGSRYVLEQNSLWLMGILFGLALIYPLFTIYHIIKNR